ncbi:hypothetical protein BJ508DRAFT_301575 [Ascobolus immersus RN42]|uniref:Uncharacterized protein n=1 Tax=Ascobolus immersus RN42 TaxID=1160509 RepID=A0A3N4IRA7_ASCIM|nr:hypothetical protein BJ508DRAFT_301575 [Ascobolus immersus RN42]
MCSTDTFLALLAILFPPLPVWVKRGVCSADGMINLALCCLGFLPGLIHAWYIISKYPDPDATYEPLATDNVPHTYTNNAPGGYIYSQPGASPHPQPQIGYPQPQQSYGAFNGHHQDQSPRRYQEHRQQTDVDAGEGNVHGPPSYAEVVKDGGKGGK